MARVFLAALVIGLAALLSLGLSTEPTTEVTVRAPAAAERPAMGPADSPAWPEAQSIAPELKPSPKWTPEQVVQIQLTALANADDPFPNAGVEIAFRFASPANRSVTGPLQRFSELVRNPVYAPMLDYRQVRFGSLQVRDAQASQVVVLTDGAGDQVAYRFDLSRQAVDNTLCWVTDQVVRLQRLPTVV